MTRSRATSCPGCSEEDRALLAKHAAGIPPAEIAAHPDHRRSERAIVKRLGKMGVV